MYDIADLHVFDWDKSFATAAPWPAHGLVLDTCLRRLVVQYAAPLQSCGARHYRGAEAYRYLLEVTSGLRSRVPGETNVFGQFRAALAGFLRRADVGERDALAPLLQSVVADTRAIRRAHLQNVGGSSYARLVRRLVAAAPGDRVLILGAGNLARSLVPFFQHQPLGLWNRHAVHSGAVEARIFAPDEIRAAAAWAHHAILTTPPAADDDFALRASLAAADLGTTVHLGHRRDRDAAWTDVGRYFDLDDVFDLRATLAHHDAARLDHARAACRQAAARFVPNPRSVAAAGALPA